MLVLSRVTQDKCCKSNSSRHRQQCETWQNPHKVCTLSLSGDLRGTRHPLTKNVAESLRRTRHARPQLRKCKQRRNRQHQDLPLLSEPEKHRREHHEQQDDRDHPCLVPRQSARTHKRCVHTRTHGDSHNDAVRLQHIPSLQNDHNIHHARKHARGVRIRERQCLESPAGSVSTRKSTLWGRTHAATPRVFPNTIPTLSFVSASCANMKISAVYLRLFSLSTEPVPCRAHLSNG
jgi:hypothetical protein